MADPTQTDPFASIAKPTAQPAAQPATPTPAGGSDPFASIAKAPAAPTTPATPPSSEVGALIDKYVEGSGDPDPNYRGGPLAEETGGALKSAAGLVGHVLNMGNAIAQKLEPKFITDRQQEGIKDVQEASDWLRAGSQPTGFWEGLGAVGEQTLEFIGTDGLLKLAGAGAEAPEAAEHLKQAQKTAEALKANPKIAGLVALGLKAAKDGLAFGAQTYAHTEDATQAALAAGTAGVLRAGGEGASAVGRWVKRVAPRVLNIAGVDIPALATQVNENGKAVEGGAGEAPAIAEAQQQGAGKVVENVAQSAARSALEKINATRPAASAIADASRQLPAPEGSQPFTFTLGGPPTTETATGDLLQPARKGVALPGPNQTYTSASADQIAEGTAPRNKGTTGADITTEEERPNLGPPAARSDSASGGGTVQTTDPAEAESWLSQLEQVQQSKIYESMPKAQQDAIEAQREQLSQQLSLYHASPYAKRFDPVDIEGSLGYVRNFGEAADQIQASAKPIYAQLDRASGGDFTKWNGQAKQALKIMRSATSVEAYEGAEQRYQQATGAIDNLITRHAGDVSQADYQAARSAWRDSSRLDELHAVMERMTNGITSEESEQGLTRVMTGRTKALEAYLAKGTNRAQLEGLIGTDGVTNLKQLTQLLSKPSTTRAVAGVLRNSFASMGGTLRVGAGGSAGAMVAHMLGLPWYEGVAAGAFATEGMRAILRDAMVNPRIGTLVDFAARNGVDPKIYAPLIARAIVVPLEQPQQNQGEPGDPGAKERDRRNPMMVEENPRGLLQKGNLPIWNRPVVHNADGSDSTEYSVSFSDDKGREVLVPTVVSGRFLTPDGKKPPEGSAAERQMFHAAWGHYLKTGEQLGIFDNPNDADQYAEKLHNRGNQ